MPTIRMSCTESDNGQSPLAVQGLNDFLLAFVVGRGPDHIFHPKLRSDSKISQPHITTLTSPTELRTMSLQCPRCHSLKVASFHHAMKIGAAIGTLGGAARGACAALAGSQAGALVGAINGPLGVTLGAVSGAILGSLVGGAGGCALGAQLGDKLDRHVLAHNLCLICGHRFNLTA